MDVGLLILLPGFSIDVAGPTVTSFGQGEGEEEGGTRTVSGFAHCCSPPTFSQPLEKLHGF